MPAELSWESGAALSSLLLLIRLSGMFVVVPIPGLRLAPLPVRACCGLLLALALASSHSVAIPNPVSAATFVLVAVSELGLGLMAGVIAGLLGDLLIMTVQMFALQAGYSYASSIDPSSEADSNVLQSLAQLASTLLFFQLSLHAPLLKAFERSLTTWPPGAFWRTSEPGAALIHFGATILELSVRLALPFSALLLLTDLTLALLGRLNSQLQLLSLAFPVKMLGTLALFAVLAGVVPGVYRQGGSRAMEFLERWMP